VFRNDPRGDSLDEVATGEILLRREFRPDHAQLEFGAVGSSYPEWDFGDEPVVANGEKVVVATRPDFEGAAVVEVRRGTSDEPLDDASALIFDGVIRVSGDGAEVGTYLGGDLERIALSPGEHRLRVFVDEPGYASRVVFSVGAERRA
jgi:hypothetical protein